MHRRRSQRKDVWLTGPISVRATLAQSAEQTLRKRQVKGSIPLGGLADSGRPQRFVVGALLCLMPKAQLRQRSKWPKRPQDKPVLNR